MKQKLKLALVGAGERGQYCYAPYAKMHGYEIEFVAVADPHKPPGKIRPGLPCARRRRVRDGGAVFRPAAHGGRGAHLHPGQPALCVCLPGHRPGVQHPAGKAHLAQCARMSGPAAPRRGKGHADHGLPCDALYQILPQAQGADRLRRHRRRGARHPHRERGLLALRAQLCTRQLA